MKRLLSYLLVAAFTCGASALLAQQFGHDMRSYYDYGEQFYAAAEESADASELVVRINTANTLFAFERTGKTLSGRGAYFATRDISIELRERPFGQVLKTVNQRDSIFTVDFAVTTSKDAWNSIILRVPLDAISLPKNLELHIEVRDVLRSQLAIRPENIDLSLRSFHAEKSMTGADSAFIGLSDLTLFEKPVDAYTYISKNRGNTEEFSHDITGGITIALPKDIRIDSVNLELTQLSSIFQEKKFEPVKRAWFSAKSEDIISGRLLKAASADSEVTYKIVEPERSDSIVKYYTILFKLPGALLEQGKYRLDVKAGAGGSKRSVSQPVDLEWHDMPLSLENPRDAIPPLVHITTEDQFKELSSGSREEQVKKLYAFWKKQDPTPETAYNERMAEFYRRADYAYFNFARNTRMLDGAMTDRGKIYILYGAPTNIERTFLLGEQPVEIWTYANNVKKIVKFTDTGGHGDYKLSEVKGL